MNSERFSKIIAENKTFLLTAHVNPDPDAITSELVMARYLKSLGKKVMIVNTDGMPKRLLFLSGARAIKQFNPNKKLVYDVAIVLDSGDLRRVGAVRQAIASGKPIVNIDHHITSEHFGDLNLVDVKASSTAEVLFNFLATQKFKFDKTTATLLYVGIMTDTGSFRFENTSAHTHAVACQLMKFGIAPAELYKKMYETVPLNDFNYFARVISRFEILAGGKVLYLELSRRTVQRFSKEFDLRDKIFRELRTIKGVEVVVILTEQKPRVTQVNLRSHGQVDVAQIASRFKGGGHRRASGCSLACAMPETKKKILGQISKVL